MWVAIALVILTAGLAAAVHWRHAAGKLIGKWRHGQTATAPKSGPYVPQTLQLRGWQFNDVLGYPPYYLDAPQIDSVVFVTRLSASGTNTIHIFNLKNGRDIQVNTLADFGRNIGMTNGGFLDYVESATTDRVDLSSEMNAGVVRKITFHLDLPATKLTGRDEFFYDHFGKLTNTQHLPGF